MQRVAAVATGEPYVIQVRFEDGTEGPIDLSPLVGEGVFAVLADPERFAQAFVDPETHTVAWPGGIDLCPDTLHADVLAARQAA